MNVAKNWALTIMLIALAFAHFSSELLLKEQMIIPVKKNVHQRWSYQRKIDRFKRNLPKKNPAKLAVFYWLFLGALSPQNFPWNRLIFLRICPLKILRRLTFFPLKSCKIGQFFCEFWIFSREIGRLFHEFWLFSRENPAKSADFSANLPLKIPRNFAFFSLKYQKPCTYSYFHDFQAIATWETGGYTTG